MNLENLIRRFRVALRDTAVPYLVSDEDATDWLNDAQDQACIRGRLIRDDFTADVVRIDLTVGQHSYPLHASAYELSSVRLIHASGEKPTELPILSTEWLDRNRPGWRDEDDKKAMAVIQDDTRLRVVGTFEVGDYIALECYRLPLLAMANDNDEPEIHAAHHIHLIQWAIHKAMSVPDSESFDPNKAERAEAEFTAHFGLHPDSDLRRITRHDTEHHSYSVLP